MFRKKLIPFLVGMLLVLAVALSSFALPHAPAKASYPPDGGGRCYGWPTLSYGSTGSYVSFLQEHLNADFQAGWFPNSPNDFHPLLAVDGQFGPLTQKAVKDIQTKYHAVVDGIVGPVTWYLVNPGCGVG